MRKYIVQEPYVKVLSEEEKSLYFLHVVLQTSTQPPSDDYLGNPHHNKYCIRQGRSDVPATFLTFLLSKKQIIHHTNSKDYIRGI